MARFALQTTNEFVLPDGRKIKTKAVSLARVRGAQNKARKDMEARGLSLTPITHPVAGVLVAPGAETPTEEYTDETILEADEVIQKAYAQYIANKAQQNILTATYMLQTLLLRGTDYEVPDDGWVEKQIDDGMEVPDDPEERYLHYLTTEVLIPPAVAQECAKHILRVSLEGADPKVLQAFEDAFRGPVQV